MKHVKPITKYSTNELFSIRFPNRVVGNGVRVMTDTVGELSLKL